MGKKKRIIVLFILIIIALLTIAITRTQADSYEITSLSPTYNINLEPEKNFAQKVLGYIRNITAIATVVIIAFFGLKFMVGSADERAEYKKSFIPLIIGVFIVLGASTIMNIVWNINRGSHVHKWTNFSKSSHKCISCNEEEDHKWKETITGKEWKCSICPATTNTIPESKK